MTHILDQLIASQESPSAYGKTLGLPRPKRWEPGRIWMTWQVDPGLLTPWGSVFGGFLAALADEVAGQAAFSVLEEGETFGTSDLRVTPLRAVREGRLDIEAYVVHRGRSTIYVDVEMRNEDGLMTTKASALQVISRGDSPTPA